MKYAVFHLLNDYSGSPKVLKSVIGRMLADGDSVTLHTSRGGHLDSLNSPRLRRVTIPYSFTASKTLTAVRFVWAQIVSFFAVLRFAFSRNTEVYVNTILPVGAALGARLIGKRVTLHCHEIAAAKGRHYRALAWIMLRLANRVICVSEYQARTFPAGTEPEIIPNTLPRDFTERLKPDPEAAFERKRVLMLTSLKAYKGTREFLNLAALMPEFSFSLVINDTEEAIRAWLKANGLTPSTNLEIHSRREDVTPFYNEASVVLNLSNPRLFIETFGMTALEARACRLPVIVPKVGGIAEMIADGVNGYCIDCHDTALLKKTITSLLTDRDLYLRIANNLVRSEE